MRDLKDYLREYFGYLVASLQWRKALASLLLWLTGMLAPVRLRSFLELPAWAAITWMIGWALLGYVFAPYGLWKHQRSKRADRT